MSFILLLIEVFPDLRSKICDVWFRIQDMKGSERLAAEAKLVTLGRLAFKAKPNSTVPRSKWEVITTQDEVFSKLNTFFNELK